MRSFELAQNLAAAFCMQLCYCSRPHSASKYCSRPHSASKFELNSCLRLCISILAIILIHQGCDHLAK